MDAFLSGKKISILAMMMVCALAACSGVNKAPRMMSAQAYYQQGLQQLAQVDTAAAAQTLEELNINYPFHAETGELNVRLIKGYYEAGQADAAIEQADRFIAMYPTHKDIAYVHYLAGMANYARGRRDISMDVTTSDPGYAKAALARFRTLVECCDNTEHAFNAKQYIYHLESMISLYELRYMEWDYDAGRIDAAAQRGISLLVSYPNSIAAKRARMMLESDNFRAYRAGINQAIREAHPVVPVAEMAPVEAPAPRFTIHVASDNRLADLEHRVTKMGLAGEVDYYRHEEGSEVYYIAGFGTYAAREEAKADRLRVRVRTEVPDMWVRSLDNSRLVEDVAAVKQAETRARANRPSPSFTPVALSSVAKTQTPAPKRQDKAEPKPVVAESFYAVQMMSYSAAEPLKKAVQSLELDDDVGLYSHVVKGETYFIALYGHYPDWSAGKEGLADLERRTGKSGYWLRKIDGSKVRPVE
ncbi:hypothetical protein Tel_01805 [Candidatus Tenderia electrophaga]|jgi:outer membrane protein assembly factor BamD|uniref:SPOR domain-containing protein n=1 Tax=Candidatus Tenderia electrophaga TaxID=1748243 RepID=A0A0S2T9Y4_9GAMM|nr:hypothetical protein Tel_01805 [Candidatus Tenderia electrophaga]